MASLLSETTALAVNYAVPFPYVPGVDCWCGHLDADHSEYGCCGDVTFDDGDAEECRCPGIQPEEV